MVGQLGFANSSTWELKFAEPRAANGRTRFCQSEIRLCLNGLWEFRNVWKKKDPSLINPTLHNKKTCLPCIADLEWISQFVSDPTTCITILEVGGPQPVCWSWSAKSRFAYLLLEELSAFLSGISAPYIVLIHAYKVLVCDQNNWYNADSTYSNINVNLDFSDWHYLNPSGKTWHGRIFTILYHILDVIH